MKIFTSAIKQQIFRNLISVLLLTIVFLYTPDIASAQSGKAIITHLLLPSPGTGVASPADGNNSEPSSKMKDAVEINKGVPGANAHVTVAPGNDNCGSATFITPNGNCTYGTTALATTEAGETFGCIGAGNSVWYSFIATQANMWLAIRPEPTGTYFCLNNFGIRVYLRSGLCPPSGGVVGCRAGLVYSGNQINNVLNLTTLTAGSTYYVQVTPDATCGNLYPNFCIRLDEPSNCTTCANICGPMCVWAGAPPTVNNITSTCPSYGWSPPMNQFDSQTNCYSFTASNDTVWLQQIVYAYCNPGNTISFTYNLYTSGCGLIQSGNVFANNLITGLTVGTIYKICYTLQSACSWDSVAWPYAYTTSSTLPVELVSFGAMSFNEKVKLYWSTASEENCKEYIIEKTRNARDFAEIAHVTAAGNSTSLLNYKAYDNSPVEGNNYYRLKQVDFNGKFTYTKLISVNFSPSLADLSIIPNPAKDKATITYNASGNFPTLIKVTDTQGKTVYSRQFDSKEGINEYSFNMSELAKGIYSVQLIVDDQNMISKLVKE